MSFYQFHNPKPTAGAGAVDHHYPKLPMFEKPLTPSDVGKLNRLVIPKQYAEQYFPLSPAAPGAADSAAHDKGLLLSFEDDSGKVWRFRYSYWNSSQSYVLTKGWSRFVKDNRLQPGDAVVFQRHFRDPHRLFIGCNRRSPDTPPLTAPPPPASAAGGGGGGWTRMFCSSNVPYPISHPLIPSPPYQSPHAESSVQSQTVSVGNSKILRLFGVNMECQTDVSEPESPSMLGSGSGLTGRDPTRHNFYTHYSSPLPHHMAQKDQTKNMEQLVPH